MNLNREKLLDKAIISVFVFLIGSINAYGEIKEKDNSHFSEASKERWKPSDFCDQTVRSYLVDFRDNKDKEITVSFLERNMKENEEIPDYAVNAFSDILKNYEKIRKKDDVEKAVGKCIKDMARSHMEYKNMEREAIMFCENLGDLGESVVRGIINTKKGIKNKTAIQVVEESQRVRGYGVNPERWNKRVKNSCIKAEIIIKNGKS